MRLSYIVLLALGLLLVSLTAACGDDAGTEDTNAAENGAEATERPINPQTRAAEPEPEPEETPEPEHVEFDAANFDENSAVINNEWMPMAPGARWIFDGYTTEDDEQIPHRIEFTVTDLTKEILGVRTVVAWIVDISDDEIVEKEIAFYAQDVEGNVWYFGEHAEEYEEGEFVIAETWIPGVQESLAGVKMWADAEERLGPPGYFQGWAPSVEWSDYGTVDQLLDETCVTSGCYEDILVIAESSLDEVGVFQLKYYSRGIGEVRVGWRGEPETPEGLQLTSASTLSAEDLAPFREEALALEAHAYEVSAEVYGDTAPAQ
jgi:hypothetical protein